MCRVIFLCITLCALSLLTVPTSYADSCNDLLLRSKDPKLEEGLQKLSEFFNRYDEDVASRFDIKKVTEIRPYIDQILKTSRPQDIPLDLLDRIARITLHVGTGENLFLPLQRQAALRLLEKQKILNADQEIARIEDEIQQMNMTAYIKNLDRNFSRAPLPHYEYGVLEFNLTVLKHVLYTNPELLTENLLTFMHSYMQTARASKVRDSRYAWHRVDEILQSKSAVQPAGSETPQ